jgi:hypothetical protein
MKCKLCKQPKRGDIVFIHRPTILIIETGIARLQLQDLPFVMKLNNYSFRHLFSVFHTPNPDHFTAVFTIDGYQYIVDDLAKNEIYLAPFELLQRNDKNKKFYQMPVVASFYFTDTGLPEYNKYCAIQ